jgi:hypothetical protein
MKNKKIEAATVSLRANRADVLGKSVERIVERLEQRILLSANDAALVGAISAALRADNSGLAAGLERLKNSSLADSALPMLGSALSSQYSLGLDSLLGARSVGPNPSFADLRAALEGPAGLPMASPSSAMTIRPTT